MPSRQKLDLLRSVPILQAEERLKKEVSDAELYDLVLLATGSEEQASKALQDRVTYRVKHNQTVNLG